LLSGFYVD